MMGLNENLCAYPLCCISQMATLGLILLPIRGLAMLVLIMIGGFVGFLCNLGVTAKAEPEPYQGLRRMGQNFISKLGRALAFVMGFHHIKTKGKLASSDEAPVIVIAPHYSFMDAPVSIAIANLTYMSRKENDHAYFLGHTVRAFQPIYVKRGKRSTREETVKEIQRRSRAKGAWPNICVFPEGTCTNGQCLITFKPGAFYAGVPVQPVLFKYTKECIPWTWIAPSTVRQIAYLLMRLNNTVEIEFLPVYKPNDEERENAILYANNVRDVMARALELPTTDHSFEDCCLMLEADSKNLPMETGLVEYSKISKDLGLNLDRLKELLGKFAVIDQNKDGVITLEEFSQYFVDVEKDKARSIFDQIATGQCGYIDFRSFVYATSNDKLPEI